MSAKRIRGVLAVLAAFAAGAAPVSAQLIVSSLNSPVTVTFDADVAGVLQMRTGTGGTRGVSEPGHWERSPWNTNKALTLLSEGATLAHKTIDMFGRGSVLRRGSGVTGYFGNDANGDSDTSDAFGGSTAPRVEHNLLGSGNSALQLNTLSDWANTKALFRIQNNTGVTVNLWNFKFDVWGADSDNDRSTVYWDYAANNSNDPEIMTFTGIGSQLIPNNGGTLALITSVDTTVNVAVNHGDYLVLQFRTAGVNSGSASAINDLVVEAIPEPGTLAFLAGAGGLMLLRRRRRHG